MLFVISSIWEFFLSLYLDISYLFIFYEIKINETFTSVWNQFCELNVGSSGAGRQTLLFSATFSKEVREVAAVTLRKGYTIVDTVGEEVEQTHSHGR